MSVFDERPSDITSRAKWFKTAFIVLVIVAMCGLFYLLKQWLGEQTVNPGKKKVQQITVIAPPPPPPPPPPQVEEPPPEVEEVEMEEPEPTPEAVPDEAPSEAPPGDQLGLDADGTGAGDAFGLVGKKGGRGLLSGGGGDPYTWYSSALQQKLFEALNENHDIRRAAYSIIVHLWIAEDGGLKQVKLVKGSSNAELDAKIKDALAQIDQLDPPVSGMPQPVKIKLTARL